jgi:hypothetical protein
VAAPPATSGGPVFFAAVPIALVSWLTTPLPLLDDGVVEAALLDALVGLRAVLREELDRFGRLFARPLDPELAAARELRADAEDERFCGVFEPLALDLRLLLDPDLEERWVELAILEASDGWVQRGYPRGNRCTPLSGLRAAVFLTVERVDPDGLPTCGQG